VDIFVDYITFLNPDLKERLRNASELLPGMVMGRLPPGGLVLQTYTVDRLGELHDRSLNELFQFTSQETRPLDRVVGTGADETNTSGTSSFPTAGLGADDESAVDGEAQPDRYVPELPPRTRPTERTGRQPGPSAGELPELHTAGSPIINTSSWELPPMDPMELITVSSSWAEPFSEMPVFEELPADVTSDDASMDMDPYDPSQSAFPTLLPGIPLMPSVEPGLGMDGVAWHPDGGAGGRFHRPEPFSNLDNIYLSSPLVSPSLPPSPRMTADDASSQDVPLTYSSSFFEGVS
jgi:hypothetical protein